MYSAHSKNENEMNGSSNYSMTESCLHITNFLATKESVQVSLLKKKTYTAQNSSLSLLELRLHTQ